MRKQTWKIERNATLFCLTKFNGGGISFFQILNPHCFSIPYLKNYLFSGERFFRQKCPEKLCRVPMYVMIN